MLLTLGEFAKQLGVSRPTATKIARMEGLLVKIGGNNKVSRKKFDTWKQEKGLA